MSYLIMRRGPEQGKVFPLKNDLVKVGRGSKNNIIIHDNEVFREHLQFVETAEGHELHNLSDNKRTFVNGQVLDSVWLLQSRCIIEIGDTITLEYRLGDPDDRRSTGEISRASADPVSAMSYLIVNIISQEEPAVYPLDGTQIVVGRATSNDIVIVEPEMSRMHFQLTLTPNGYTIEDLGSTNGTMVNGVELKEPQLLRGTDVIQVGASVSFQLTNSPEKFAAILKTDTLAKRFADTQVTKGKRKTRRSEIPGIIRDAPNKTIGTGVDHTTLEDQVLVTYAREDWESVVAPLIDRLYDYEIGAWVDQYLMEGSGDWEVATEQARLECWLLVVVLSKAAAESDLVRRNWRHFQNREKPIILFIVDDVDRLPFVADKLIHVEFHSDDAVHSFDELASDIERYIGQG
jgi:pSer/pThr/pTyr-binding forkhead associated (FHA) protein